MIPFIFIINLERRTDRREHMIEIMNDMGVTDYEFVEPVLVENYDVTPNELSLIMTVKSILEVAKGRGLDTCFIFEDDVVMNFSSEFVVEKIEKAIQNLPHEWDMLYFEYCLESCNKVKKFNDHLYKVANPLCTASILYNVKTIDKINKCIDRYNKNLDNTYLRCHKNDDIMGYMVLPPLFSQDKIYATDIQNKTRLNMINLVLDNDNKFVCRHEIFFKIKWFNALVLIVIVGIILFVLIIGSTKLWTSNTS